MRCDTMNLLDNNFHKKKGFSVKEKYEKIIKILSDMNWVMSARLKSFNEQEADIVGEIFLHNKACEKDPSCNNVGFWEDILEKSHMAEQVLFAIALSPYTPKEILENVVIATKMPETMIEVLKRDAQLDSLIYDHIQSIAKEAICNLLISSYKGFKNSQLPFSQYAIDYYAKKIFNKKNIKSDKMLITLVYTKDKDILENCHLSSALNETRLNYLIDNRNISEEKRNKMFVGVGFNINDITPDYNAIHFPTPFMVNEIYTLNSEGYFISDDKAIKKSTTDKINDLITSGLTTEGIEKDIINKYEKGDSTYRFIVKQVLSHTKNMGVLETASKMDYRMFDTAFTNPNLTPAFLQKYGSKHIKKIIAGAIKRENKTIPPSILTYDMLIQKISLDHQQYETILSSLHTKMHDAIAISPHTPPTILKQIIDSPKFKANEGMYSVSNLHLAAKLNLRMREKGFTNEEITNWCCAFLKTLHTYSTHIPFVTTDRIDTMFYKLWDSGRFNDLTDIIQDLSKEHDNPHEKTAISEFSRMKEIFINSTKCDITETIHEYNCLNPYKRQRELYSNFTATPLLGGIYLQMHEYGDELIKVSDMIESQSHQNDNRSH